MERHEKIKFIRQSRFTEYAYAQLDTCSDAELDEIVQKILNDLQKEEASARENHLTSFYIYLN